MGSAGIGSYSKVVMLNSASRELMPKTGAT